jgi:hypothetical protein
MLALAACLPAAAPARAVDPLPGLLTDGGDPESIRDRVKALGDAACPTLSAYAGAPDPRAREQAVATMDDAGCDRLEDYRDFFGDRSAWVVRAVARALGRHRIAGGVPFLLAHLEDRRRLVSDGDSVTIAASAEQALRRLTAQPIAPVGAQHHAPDGRDATVAAAWRAWYAAHASDPPAQWLSDGRAALRAALTGGSPPARYAALETLALVGDPVVDLLVEALQRRPGEITAALQCDPDSPPRVTEEIPCTLSLRNDAARRIPLALGEIDLRLGPVTAAPPPAPGKPAGKEIKKDKKAVGPAKPAAEPPLPAEPRPEPERLAGAIVDMAPGQVLRRPLSVGPVPSAGRYEAVAAFQDLGRRLNPGAFPADLPRLEATLLLRFEQ